MHVFRAGSTGSASGKTITNAARGFRVEAGATPEIRANTFGPPNV